jgi:hypothetical protein
MDDLLTRMTVNVIRRTEGPMHLRLVLQPTMALIFATIDGLKDAKNGKPPYFWSLITASGQRVEMIRNGWKSIGKVFLLAAVLDAVYQFIVQGFIYPGGAIIVAFVLAIVPYLIMRGSVTRLAPKKR